MISYTYVYRPAKTRIFKGSYSDLISECNCTGEHLIEKFRNNNKLYKIGFPPVRLIFEVVNNVKTRAIEPTSFIIQYYNKKRIREVDYQKLVFELFTHNINFEYLYKYYAVPTSMFYKQIG